VRPSIGIVTKGLEESLREHVKAELSKGPLAESEIWEVALDYLTPRLPSMGSSLIRNYRMQFGRKIGKNTAEKNILAHMRLVLSRIKKGLLHTQKPVIAGGKRFGRIFYTRGQEGKLQAKVRSLVQKGGGIPLETLKEVERGPLKETPRNKRAINLLEHYGLVERRSIGGQTYAVAPGYSPVSAEFKESNARFPDHYRVWKPFKIETWVLRDGPTKVALKFDLAAWDPVNRQFYLALEREYVGLNHLKALREKHLILGLPAKLVVFCKSIGKAAESYAGLWGIEIRDTTGK